MKTVVTILILIALVVAIFHIVTSFRAASGTTWQRLYAATRDSATLFWGMTVTAVTGAINGLLNISDALGAPEVRTFVTENFSPQIASAIIVGVVILLSIARMRTLSKSE
jgi:hypothetical protein